MSVLDSITSLVKAATKLIRTVWPKHEDKPLVREHFAISAGSQVMCMYCRKVGPWPEGEHCLAFH